MQLGTMMIWLQSATPFKKYGEMMVKGIALNFFALLELSRVVSNGQSCSAFGGMEQKKLSSGKFEAEHGSTFVPCCTCCMIPC